MKYLSLVCLAVMLGACAAPKGNYFVKAVDANGVDLTSKMVHTASGTGVYTTRNALCYNFPKATIIIADVKTGQELSGESPYKCR